MRNFKLATMIFAIMATICFTACDNDNDKKHDANTCEPAACEMAEHAAEMGCDDAGHCVVKACAEAFKLGDDGKCAADEPACTCDPDCKEDEDCVKGDDGACGCRAKDKPAACDPACEDGKTKCECTNDACACVPVNPPANECDGKSAGDECAEGKTCQDDNGALACKDKAAPAPTCDPACDAEKQDCVCEADKCECKDKNAAEPEDPCKDKAENADCGENKTCQKGEGDKLECKDKPADPAPSEPTQPDKPE